MTSGTYLASKTKLLQKMTTSTILRLKDGAIAGDFRYRRYLASKTELLQKLLPVPNLGSKTELLQKLLPVPYLGSKTELLQVISGTVLTLKD